jgi:hypothetical protein
MKQTNSTDRPAKPLEFAPDAWERFERAVGIVAKAPPQHRSGKKALLGTRQKKLGQAAAEGRLSVPWQSPAPSELNSNP